MPKDQKPQQQKQQQIAKTGATSIPWKLIVAVLIAAILGLGFAGYFAAQKASEKSALLKPGQPALPEGQQTASLQKVENPKDARQTTAGIALDLEQAQGYATQADEGLSKD